MTEDQIERRVERYIDHLDRVFMAGEMTQDNYDKAMREILDWADIQYRSPNYRRR
jgi:hypothetical protein